MLYQNSSFFLHTEKVVFSGNVKSFIWNEMNLGQFKGFGIRTFANMTLHKTKHSISFLCLCVSNMTIHSIQNTLVIYYTVEVNL